LGGRKRGRKEPSEEAETSSNQPEKWQGSGAGHPYGRRKKNNFS